MERIYPVIDSDGHVEEGFVNWQERLPKQYWYWAPRYFSDEEGVRFFYVDGKFMTFHMKRHRGFKHDDRPYSRTTKPAHRWHNREGMRDPHKRIPDMDEEGIDIAVLFGTPVHFMLSEIEDPALAVAVARAYNDWLAEYCNPYRNRLKGVALLPVQSPSEAAKELRRSVTELGFVGGIFPARLQDKTPDNEFFHPVYKEAQDLDVPLCVHLASSKITGAMVQQKALHTTFAALDVIVAAGCFLAGGPMDVFPRLRMMFTEIGCGWIPYIVERLQGQMELYAQEAPWKKFSLEEIVRSDRFYCTVDPTEATIPFVAATTGEDRLLYISDYSHGDCLCPDSVKIILERTDISDRLKRKILSENALALFKTLKTA